MTELLTAAQMRAIEQAAIASGAVTGLELMERAGRGVVEAILEWRPELATAPHRAVVLCGPGNNGGDGFVVARLLKQRGWEIEVFLYGDEESLPPDAAENARRWREMGGIEALTRLGFMRKFDESSLLIDALFGAGLTRPLGDDLRDCLNIYGHPPVDGIETMLVDENRAMLFEVVAVDAPTGLCLDSGRVLGSVVPANLTVTFHAPRVGHFVGSGPPSCGELTTRPIGVESAQISVDLNNLLHGLVPSFTYLTSSPTGIDKSQGHKFAHGHALILSGGPGKGGAARLAARGALRIGAGLVTVGCPTEALTENAARLDAIMLAQVSDVEALVAEIADRKVTAICIGPGFGLGDRLRSVISSLLGGSHQPSRPVGTTGQRPTAPPGGRFASARGRSLPSEQGSDDADFPAAPEEPLSLVLDADALTEFRDDPETLFAMLHAGCVLTPHEGEFGRLFPDILEKLKAPAAKGPAYSKVDATREAAARAGCVVLFKGADTVIAAPDGLCAINSAHYERAAPWLATAGSGDVLTGFITGLLARGFAPMAAAETAAWLHVECARKFGPGLVAEDLPEQLPAVFRDLGL